MSQPSHSKDTTPALLWAGEVRHPEPGSRGQWRVVLTEGSYFNGRYHESEPRLVIERAVEQAALGEPVWEYAEALPADVLLALLGTRLTGSLEEQVRVVLGEGAA